MPRFSQITTEWIEQQSFRNHEPRWLREQRKGAWSLQNSFLGSLPLSQANGWSRGLLPFLDPELARRGVVFTDMKTAVLERADLLELYLHALYPISEDQMSQVSVSLWQNGYFLYVPPKVKILKPFFIEFCESGQNNFRRNVVIADEGAEVHVEDRQKSEKTHRKQHCLSSLTQIFAQKNSTVSYWSVQDYGQSVRASAQYYGFLEDHAQLKTIFTLLGGLEENIFTKNELKGDYSRLEQSGFIIGNHRQQFRLNGTVKHTGKFSESLIRYKGIVNDEAQCVFDEKLSVAASGKNVKARLEEEILLLGEKSRADAIPRLDIHCNDVKVSHAASVSRMDEEKLFYLMSRGLSKDQAKQIFVEGFTTGMLPLTTSA